MPYQLLADLTLAVHFLFVAYVVGALVAVLVGAFRQWAWVRNLYFRVSHLLCIGVVVLQSWLGLSCPLTTLETWLRSRAGEEPYAGSFIAFWMHTLLYYQAPAWVFAVAYTLFGAAVIIAWLKIPPRSRSTLRNTAAGKGS